MLTHLKTTHFMGKDIDEPISPKMIYIGENTSGKSTRVIAITLCILGFVPFSAKPAKKAGDILRDFGDGEFMSIEITCDGHRFERSFVKNKKGVVSQKFKLDGRTRNKTAFAVELEKFGAPRIIDVQSFIKSSDTERISTLFGLYPPDGDVSTIDSKIAAVKEKISGFNEKIGEADASIKSLTKSKNEIELPAGSLAETKKAIEALTGDVLTAREELKHEEIKQAKEKAVEDEKINAKAEREKTQSNLDHTMEKNTKQWAPSEPVGNAPSNDVKKTEHYQNHTTSNTAQDYPKAFKIDTPENDPAISIQKIIDAMKSSGCELCPAGMVAKVELRKYKL